MKARKLITISALLAGCSGAEEPGPAAPTADPTAPPPTATATADAPPAKPAPRADASLLPRAMFFGNPDKTHPRLSPDGKHIAYLAPEGGVMNVWVAPAGDPGAAKAVTHEKERGIRRFFWAFNNKEIIYPQDKGGNEDFHVMITDVGAGTTRDLTPMEKVRAEIEGVSHKKPNEILIRINQRDPKNHDIYRADLKTGKLTLVLENKEGFAGYLTDSDYNVRGAMRMTADGGQEILKPDAKKKGEWAAWIKIAQEDSLTVEPIGFDKSGKTLYMVDSRGRNTAALFAVDVKSDKAKLLAEDPKADVDDVMVHPDKLEPQAASAMYDRAKWQVLDKSIQADFDALAKVAPGDVHVVSRTHDDKTWLVSFVVDDGPVKYYRWDRKGKKADFLFVDRKELEGKPLSKMTPVVIKSRDGLDLVSYLTVPKASDPDGDGKPNAALPMVLLVHGGPWARDHWGVNGTHQWFANRGYATLSVNYRGSTGFGKKFINASDREWAGKMHDDLMDAVKWAVDGKVADKDKIAIMGGSYGGFATLVGLTFTPDAFACGVDIVGPSNLQTLIATIPPYWAPALELFYKRVGDPRTEEGKKFLNERSPLSHVDAIKKPLLIGQGANDPRVKQSESDQIVKAMTDKKIPVTYVLYPDEGHGFNRPQNRLSFNAVAETFLAQCLGGPYQPIGDDFKGSSISVPSGAAQVHDLEAALPKK